jgi:hypothetical protein
MFNAKSDFGHIDRNHARFADNSLFRSLYAGSSHPTGGSSPKQVK